MCNGGNGVGSWLLWTSEWFGMAWFIDEEDIGQVCYCLVICVTLFGHVIWISRNVFKNLSMWCVSTTIPISLNKGLRR